MRLAGPILVTALVFASAPNGYTQDDGEKPRRLPSPDQIKEWLESSDSAKAMWGAWYASQSEDTVGNDVYVTIMSQRLARWRPAHLKPNSNREDEGFIHLDEAAISEILFALIEKNESVPVLSLTPIATKFPNEAPILTLRLPEAESVPLLESWYGQREQVATKTERGGLDLSAFAGVAAMLLAKTPPPGFAASILAKFNRTGHVYRGRRDRGRIDARQQSCRMHFNRP